MKFKLTVRTSKVGSETERDFEVPDEDLDGLADDARDRVIDDWGREAMLEAIEWDWREA